jgi:predicted secreted protein
MSQAQTSFGVSLLQGIVPVAEITSLTPPTFNSETIDVTNHDSVGRMAEFIGGMRSSDDVKITSNLILDDPGQALLLADQADGLVHAFTIVFPTAWGASFDFSAVVLKCAVSPFTAKGDAVQLETTLKVSGAVTLNETLSAGATTPFFVFTPAGLTAPLASATPGTYVNTQASTVESVVVKPYATAATAVITVNGNVVATGVDSTAIALGEDGSLTPVTIVVKETGKVAVTYAIMVLRETTV